MMRRVACFGALIVVTCLVAAAPAGDGNRLAYLDENDPFYPHREFARLTTPQWVGEEGVEAVVILSIDDMRGHERWEAFLRPLLERLKKIDGRAPVSIMTCQIDPRQPHLQTWLSEGLSLEAHTFDHPCPLLQKGDLAAAKRTYDRCVDQMDAVPGSRAVAFRMPCCDSQNTPSPRFYAEIFNRTTPGGNFLEIDSSVFNIITGADPELPRELVVDDKSQEIFRRYLPFPSYVVTVEDYPYPYVIGKLCWEFPCVVPSDWSAQHVQQPDNPRTVEDLKRALDAAVVKQGVFTLVFHPHKWIKAEQLVELVDYAVRKHGKKVKFLNFREAADRLRQNLLAGNPLRSPDGGDNGVRLLDVNHDGYMDVVVGNSSTRKTRVWEAQQNRWQESTFPLVLNEADSRAHFGIVGPDGNASLIAGERAWHFTGNSWAPDPELAAGLQWPEGADVCPAPRFRRRRTVRIPGGQCRFPNDLPPRGVQQLDEAALWSPRGHDHRRCPWPRRRAAVCRPRSKRLARRCLFQPVGLFGASVHRARQGLVARARSRPARRSPGDPHDRPRRYQQRRLDPLAHLVGAKRGHRQTARPGRANAAR